MALGQLSSTVRQMTTTATLHARNGLTMMGWTRLNVVSGFGEFWGYKSSGAVDRVQVYSYNGTRNLYVGISNSDEPVCYAVTGVEMTADRYYHIAITVSGGANGTEIDWLTAYVDGGQSARQKAGFFVNFDTDVIPTDFFIGSDVYNVSAFHQNIRAWNRVLTPGEIRREMWSRYAVNRQKLIIDLPLLENGNYLDRVQQNVWTPNSTMDFEVGPILGGPPNPIFLRSVGILSDPSTIGNLTALTAPTTDDLVYAVDDPAGTPASRQLTLANLFKLFIGNATLTVLTGSGTYTPPARSRVLIIGVVGGGGTGGGGVNTDSSGGGGGGGGVCIKRVLASAVSNGAYAVGAAASASTSVVNGNNSTFNIDGATTITGGGGAGGVFGTTSTGVGVQAAGGVGGTATNGDLNIPGEPGERSCQYSTSNGWGGQGGTSVFGFGGVGAINTAGTAGTAYGGGGGGGHASATGDRLGGNGAAGTIFVLEFYEY